MDPRLQNLATLAVVVLAALYLVWRARRFYLALTTKSGSRCGGCTSCGARSSLVLPSRVRPPARSDR